MDQWDQEGHLRHLGSVVGAMMRARWVFNGRWRGSFSAETPHSEGGSAAGFRPPQPLKWLEFQVSVVWMDQWDPEGHVRHIFLVAGAMIHT